MLLIPIPAFCIVSCQAHIVISYPEDQNMPLLPVSQAPSELLSLFHTEKESILARYYEPDPGLFIAESAKVTLRSSLAGYEICAMLIEDAQINQEAKELFARFPDTPAYHAPSDQFREISGYPMTRGVLSLFRRKPKGTPEDLLNRLCADRCTCSSQNHMSASPASSHRLRIAVLEEVGNPANIGSIFRNAAALGIDAILLTKGCCDPLSRRCLRVSMGTVFLVPWVMTGQAGSLLIPELRKHQILSASMALSDDSVSVSDPALKEAQRLAIFLGNEGNGLPQETISESDYVVRIPMNEDVDSLNVAAASAISFWELR